jgi:hypothetical protein
MPSPQGEEYGEDNGCHHDDRAEAAEGGEQQSDDGGEQQCEHDGAVAPQLGGLFDHGLGDPGLGDDLGEDRSEDGGGVGLVEKEGAFADDVCQVGPGDARGKGDGDGHDGEGHDGGEAVEVHQEGDDEEDGEEREGKEHCVVVLPYSVGFGSVGYALFGGEVDRGESS